jgi:hypothetical protein
VGLLEAYYKSPKTTIGWGDILLGIRDATPHFRSNCLDKTPGFGRCTLGDNFHPSVRHVPHKTGNRKASCHPMGGVTKTDTLHETIKKDRNSLIGCRFFRHLATSAN